MSDDMISQEEIDALLNGGGIPAADDSPAPAGESEAPAEAPAEAEQAPTVVHLSLMMYLRMWKRMPWEKLAISPWAVLQQRFPCC